MVLRPTTYDTTSNSPNDPPMYEFLHFSGTYPQILCYVEKAA
jgi:hypothetical protein